MRRRNCVRKLDTPFVCAKKHRQMINVAYCGHTVRHCTRASRELVDEICHPRFEREIKLVRM